ncbi:MAG: PIN domain-containing protein [Betaproteobacteria bacterium]
MRIFLDANVLFSAAKSDGAVRLLIRRLLDAGHECLADEYVAIEARRNLEAKGPEALAVLDALLSRVQVAPARAPAGVVKDTDWLPEKDRPVLYAAMRLKCDALVTGDRTHFGQGYGKSFGGVTIHSPRSLAEVLYR